MPDIRPVKLKDVVDALDSPHEWECYLDRRTGAIIPVTENEAPYIEDDSETEGLPEWQQESIRRVKEALEAGDLIELPTNFDVHEWDIMRRFSEAQDDVARDELLDAIHGKGAFRMFRAAIDRMGLREDWYRFREQALEIIARDWLEVNGISFVEQ